MNRPQSIDFSGEILKWSRTHTLSGGFHMLRSKVFFRCLWLQLARAESEKSPCRAEHLMNAHLNIDILAKMLSCRASKIAVSGLNLNEQCHKFSPYIPILANTYVCTTGEGKRSRYKNLMNLSLS